MKLPSVWIKYVKFLPFLCDDQAGEHSQNSHQTLQIRLFLMVLSLLEEASEIVAYRQINIDQTDRDAQFWITL